MFVFAFRLVCHPREAFEIHRKIIGMSLKRHRIVKLFCNRCVTVDRVFPKILQKHVETNRIQQKTNLGKISKTRQNPPFIRLEMPQDSRKCTFSAFFFGETLASFKKSSYFCIAIGSWCNGNTTGFGSVILGSNPGDPTKCADWLRYRR